VKNIFTDEPIPEVDPSFQGQQQPGGAPAAPSCNPSLPEHPRVELPGPLERVAEHAALRTDWKNTPIGR
jgi:hypothetical protein